MVEDQKEIEENDEEKTEKNTGVCGEKCEVYSRVCGYMRPVSGWNKGKKSEFARRKVFDTAKAVAESIPAKQLRPAPVSDEEINEAVDRRFMGTPGY